MTNHLHENIRTIIIALALLLTLLGAAPSHATPPEPQPAGYVPRECRLTRHTRYQYRCRRDVVAKAHGEQRSNVQWNS